MEVPEAKIRMHNGSPALFIDGKPASLHIYSEGVGLTAKHHKQFSEAGVEVYELSGQNLPTDVSADELFNKGIAPHAYAVRSGKCAMDVSLCWTGPGSYDYTWLDRSIDEALKGAPDAYIIPRVWLEPPGWWLDSHPGELQQYGDGFAGLDPRWRGSLRISFASELWLSEAGEALRRLVEHIQTTYPGNIIGYHIGAGLWGEWHYSQAFHLPDTSEPMRQAFITCVRKKYGDDVEKLKRAWKNDKITFADIQVPAEAERCRTNLGVLRDPAVSQRIIDYYYCHHHVLAEAVLRFSRVVKEASKNRSLVVVFYGYTRDVGAIHEGGHLELQPVLDSPYVDCFSSPHSYRHRYAGLDGGFRALPGSIRLHRKQFIDEQDELTNIFKGIEVTQGTVYNGGYPPRSLYETIQLARRQFAHTLTEGLGAWWFGCGIADRFDDPEIMKAFKQFMQIDKDSLNRPRARVSEVAVFASLDSIFYTAHWKTPEHKLTDSLLNVQWSELYRMGAPFDIYDIADLPDERFPKDYRCYVFLNTFYMSSETREAVDRLKRDGNTLVWFYAPGAVTDETSNERPSIIQFSENSSALTGIELRLEPRATPLRARLLQTDSPWAKGLKAGMTWGLPENYAPTVIMSDPDVEVLAESEGILADTDGRPAWSVKRMKGWMSVHFIGPTVPSSVLRNVLREAGCHIYLESDDNLYVNQSYIGIHASRSGQKTVHLPSPARVVNVFDPAWPKVDGSSFTIKMKRNETALLSIESL